MLCRDAVSNMRTRMAETSLRLMLLAGWNVPFASEPVDIGCKRIAGIHIGDCIVRDLIDRFVGAFRAVENVDELCSGDCSIHLRRSIACIVLFDNAVCNCVGNIAVIPVDAVVRQGREHPHICCEYCAIAE